MRQLKHNAVCIRILRATSTQEQEHFDENSSFTLNVLETSSHTLL